VNLPALVFLLSIQEMTSFLPLISVQGIASACSELFSRDGFDIIRILLSSLQQL